MITTATCHHHVSSSISQPSSSSSDYATDIEYQPRNNSGHTGESTNVARFQEFSRLELPRLVRRTLEVTVEEEAQPLEERLKERLVDIVRDCQTQLISLFQSTTTQSQASPTLSLSQIRHAPGAGEPAANHPPNTTTMMIPIHGAQHHPGDAPVAPFQNFDSFQAAPQEAATDYIPIPAQYPEHDRLATKHEASPPAEGGGNTPDSGYDSAWHAAPLSQETYMQSQTNYTHALPFAPASVSAPVPVPIPVPATHIPQHHAQPAYSAAGTMFVESDFVDLGGYYGLFQSRTAGFEAGMMDPSWAYMNHAGGGGDEGVVGTRGGIGHTHTHGQTHGRGTNGAVM